MKKKETKKKIAFICAPYTAGPLKVEMHIVKARMMAADLWEDGYAVICPHSNSAGFERLFIPAEDFYDGYLAILSLCDAILVATNWKQSKGCRAEVALAKKLGLEFICGLPGEEKPMKEVIIRCDLCKTVMKSKGSSSDLTVGAMIKEDVCEDCLLEFDKLLGQREDLGKDTPED